jgi:hypothetical protein
MSDRLPHPDQQEAVACRSKKSRLERLKERIGIGSQPDGLRPPSRSSSSSRLSRRGKSPDPKNEKAENAQFTASANAVNPEIKPDDNEDARPDATKEPFPQVKQDQKNKDTNLEPKTDATEDDDMWKIAEDQLREDQNKRKLLDAYYDILRSKSGAKLEPAGTPKRKEQICTFIVSESKRLPDSSKLGRFGDVFQHASKYVIAAKDVITTAAAPCLPASIACAGVMLILSVSWSLQLQMSNAYVNLSSFVFKSGASETFSSKA